MLAQARQPALQWPRQRPARDGGGQTSEALIYRTLTYRGRKGELQRRDRVLPASSFR